MTRFALAALLFLPLLPGLAGAQIKPEWKDVIGTWEGDSTCATPGPSCQNERLLFRFKPGREDPDKLQAEIFAVANQRPKFAGISDCNYAAAERTLTCSVTTPKRGIWTFTVGDGDGSMQGTLALGREKTPYRNLTLQKK